MATLSIWLTTTVGLSKERTPEADPRTSLGVARSGAIWRSRVPAAAEREVRSGDEAGNVVEPLLASVLAVLAIVVTVESAPLRSDSPALSRTWLALFSAVLAGAAASCPFAAGLAAPEPVGRRVADGVRQSCRAGGDLLEVDCAVRRRQFTGQIASGCGEAGKVAWEKSDARAVARCELPSTWPSTPALGALVSTEPSDPSSGLEPFWIEQ